MDALTPLQVQPQLDLPLQELPNQYEVLGKISEGGMGAIYRARNRFTGMYCAIKVMLPEMASDARAMQRFSGEARAAMSLRHPNICQVHDFGITEHSRMPYLVMEWINGICLATKVQRDGYLSVGEALYISHQIAKALAHAHLNKVVHRDLKPQNIMISRDADGRTNVHLVDFGIAKVLTDDDSEQRQCLTKTGMVVGTPLFMSPEQAKGLRVDGRSDIYALGCVMYFVLTGRPPFIAATHIETITKHCTEPPPKFDSALKIPNDLKRIIYKAMEKEPTDRYAKMDDLSTDLRKLLSGISLEIGRLTIEKQKVKKILMILGYFLASFLVAYGFSIIMQNTFDKPTAKESASTPAHHARLHAPE
jgi:eukaryotic-like serine/threonine-protein kinase